MDMDQAQQLFIGEANELLAAMEGCLLDVESGDASIEQHIDEIFRAAHTIKGSAGLFGFDAIVAFTHNVESVLDKVRAGKLDFDEVLANLILDCQHYMQLMVQHLSDPEAEPDALRGQALLQQLAEYLNETTVTLPPKTPSPSGNIDPNHWHISIEYGEEVFRDGMDPASQLRYLQTFGTHHRVKLETRFPEADFDPESCYLSLSLVFETDAPKQQIEEAFEFIQESCKIHIATPKSMLDAVKAYPEEAERIGELLLHSGAITDRELNDALDEQQKARQENRAADSLGDVLVNKGIVDPSLVDEALAKQPHQAHKRPQDFQFLKVDARKLDNLITLIGELVTAGAANELLIAMVADERLDESFSSMVHLIEQIRDGALSLRMVQIGESFGRLKRIVRDVAKELGKDIQLDIRGAETELDKSMVEKLSDPLMHIVRNAIDHGIEAQDIRLLKGKSEKGSLCLNAYHEAGAVVIEIKDDGAGLDSEKIRAKAVDKGLINEKAVLTQEECFKLIFEPGFSTAAQVTNLSGRGVGMDVVKRNIEELRGQISIESQLGRGTTFRIRLPLTLAIIDGFQVSVGDTHLVIPVNMIQECLSFDQASLTDDRNYLNLRGDVLPFVSLREILRLPTRTEMREHIIVVQFGEKRAGLVVDELHGELQAVIKPLNEMFRAIRGIGGTTILGTGEVGFILDVPQLIEYACQQESRHYSTQVNSNEKVSYE